MFLHGPRARGSLELAGRRIFETWTLPSCPGLPLRGAPELVEPAAQGPVAAARGERTRLRAKIFMFGACDGGAAIAVTG